jgi:small subunit ribosomal protein S4
MKGDTGQNLIGLLERRLDMRRLSRQVRADHLRGPPARQPRPHPRERREVQHRQPPRGCWRRHHAVGNKAKEMALVIEAQSLPERDIPDYVSPDGTDKVTFTRVPTLDEVPYPVKMEPNLVVEFYSR